MTYTIGVSRNIRRWDNHSPHTGSGDSPVSDDGRELRKLLGTFTYTQVPSVTPQYSEFYPKCLSVFPQQPVGRTKNIYHHIPDLRAWKEHQSDCPVTQACRQLTGSSALGMVVEINYLLKDVYTMNNLRIYNTSLWNKGRFATLPMCRERGICLLLIIKI